MINNSPENVSSRQLDLSVLNWFEATAKTCLFVAAVIAAVILFAWLIPPFSLILPSGWALMQATTALSVLFLCIAFALDKRKNHNHAYALSRLFAILCIVLVAVTLLEHGYDQKGVLGTYLVAKQQLSLVYPTSIQSASCFLLLALTLFIDASRQDRDAYLLDVLIMILVILNLLYAAGYIYKASDIIKEKSSILISTQTLVCVALLTFVQIARRAPFGSYAILVSRGIAGHTARITLPVSVVISYAIVLSQKQIASAGHLGSSDVAAMTAVASAVILIVVVLLLARKIAMFEERLRNMTITDELTGAYNLRGFYLHGKQKLLEARRETMSLSLLYIDVDGLKKVNDSLGHAVGSALLCDVVTLLHDTFRENDIVSRIGGDEFAIMAHGTEDEIEPALQRLDKAVEAINASGDKPYKIAFSTGKVMIDPRSNESLETFVNRADAAMYRNKKERRAVSEVKQYSVR